MVDIVPGGRETAPAPPASVAILNWLTNVGPEVTVPRFVIEEPNIVGIPTTNVAVEAGPGTLAVRSTPIICCGVLSMAVTLSLTVVLVPSVVVHVIVYVVPVVEG